jgi:hypothetical protein
MMYFLSDAGSMTVTRKRRRSDLPPVTLALAIRRVSISDHELLAG